MKKIITILLLIFLTGCSFQPKVISKQNKEMLLGGVGVVDSYSESNFSSDTCRSTGGIGQSFTSTNTTTLDSVKFFISYMNEPQVGYAYAKIYAHSGTYGTNSLPTGSALATSDAFDVSTLTGSDQLQTFTFSGANKITLLASTYYIVTLEMTGIGDCDIDRGILSGLDMSSPTHSGNYCSSTDSINWGYNSAYDVPFYVYGDTSGASTPAPSTVSDIIIFE